MQNNYPNNVAEYLEKKCYKNWELEWVDANGIELVVVVPAICEFENIKQLLYSLSLNSQASLNKSLIIFVINNSVNATQEVRSDNELSIEYLRKLIKNNFYDSDSQQIHNSEMRVGLVDSASDGKELNDETAGVGLARKIGMDLALKVFDYSTSGKKIIVSLDADCLVEENYLLEIQNYFNQKNISAAIVDFEHNFAKNDINKSGILSYEIFLRHYVAGLLFAESTFAFHTIGSTIICDHEAYIKVGGMNTKKAAEDFYFLQKLAKHYKIHKIIKTKVYPSARRSWRVPFGTGKSMTEISSDKKEILLYDPEVFIILKNWLRIFNSDLLLNLDSIMSKAKKIHPELFHFLESRGFCNDWEKILGNTKSAKQLDYQRKNWFDAFETLKLIHHLRDASFPMMDIKSGSEKLFELVEHHSVYDSILESNDTESVYQYYLLELKKIERNLYKKLYE